MSARGDNGEALSKRTQKWCAERTTEQALAELEKARIPGGPIYSPQQALEDVHIRSAGFLQPVEYPGLPKPAPVVTPPVRLSRTPAQIRRRPPTLSEHTDDILAELGYSANEIAALRNEKVV